MSISLSVPHKTDHIKMQDISSTSKKNMITEFAIPPSYVSEPTPKRETGPLKMMNKSIKVTSRWITYKKY